MTEWTQGSLRAEAQERLNAITIGSGYTLDSSVTLPNAARGANGACGFGAGVGQTALLVEVRL